MFCGANYRKGTRFDATIAGAKADPFSKPGGKNECLQQAQVNLGQCVVGMQEDWAGSVKSLHEWFPWLNHTSKGEQIVGQRMLKGGNKWAPFDVGIFPAIAITMFCA